LRFKRNAEALGLTLREAGDRPCRSRGPNLLEVFGQVDGRHPAAAELALDAIGRRQRTGELVRTPVECRSLNDPRHAIVDHNVFSGPGSAATPNISFEYGRGYLKASVCRRECPRTQERGRGAGLLSAASRW
jgi:hypothetical protein